MNKVPLKKAEQRQIVLFTFDDGALPAYTVHTVLSSVQYKLPPFSLNRGQIKPSWSSNTLGGASSSSQTNTTMRCLVRRTLSRRAASFSCLTRVRVCSAKKRSDMCGSICDANRGAVSAGAGGAGGTREEVWRGAALTVVGGAGGTGRQEDDGAAAGGSGERGR